METVLGIIYGAALVLLFVSALIAVQRIAKGPSQLDRSVGSDLIVTVVIGIVGLWAVVSGRDTEISLLLMLSLLGFTGAASIARMVSERIAYRPRNEDKDKVADLG